VRRKPTEKCLTILKNITKNASQQDVFKELTKPRKSKTLNLIRAVKSPINSIAKRKHLTKMINVTKFASCLLKKPKQLVSPTAKAILKDKVMRLNLKMILIMNNVSRLTARVYQKRYCS